MASSSAKKGSKTQNTDQAEEGEDLEARVNLLSSDVTGFKGATHKLDKKLDSALSAFGERVKLLEDSRVEAVDPALESLRKDTAEARANISQLIPRMTELETELRELQDQGHPTPPALQRLLDQLTDTMNVITQQHLSPNQQQPSLPPAPPVDTLRVQEEEEWERLREEERRLADKRRELQHKPRSATPYADPPRPPQYNNRPDNRFARPPGQGTSRQERRAEVDPMAKFARLSPAEQHRLVGN